MRNAFRVGVIAASLLSAGCAIHPLPDDVTGVSTYHIARRIRCEAREAVKQKIIVFLKSLRDEKLYSIGLAFENGDRPISTFSPQEFPPEVRRIFEFFYDTGIAYNFQFDMTEHNDLTTTVDLLKPLTRGTFSAAIGGGLERQRQNVRTFTITDTFHHLIKNVPDRYCIDHIVGSNYIYPISGRIGIDEMVDTFVDLALFGNLAGGEKDPNTPPTMGDTIKFQTTISGSVTPKVEFTPLGRGLRLVDADLKVSAKRIDDHQVIVGLAIDKTAAKSKALVRGEVFGGVRTATLPQRAAPGAAPGLVLGRLTTASARTRSEALAADTVDQIAQQRALRTVIITNQ